MHLLISRNIRTIFAIILAFFALADLSGQESRKEDARTQSDRTKPAKLKPHPDTLLLQYVLSGPDVQGNLNYALLNAASAGNVMSIEWLIRNGADVNVETYEMVTPLMYAVAAGKPESVRTLLDNGADPNRLSGYSETPLMIAVKNENIEIAEILIRDSADVNISDKYGATALHYAAIGGSFYIADMLIYYEAAVYKRDDEGTTPLMAAVWAGHSDLADLLMQYGADPSEKDNEGFTPFLIAAQNGDTVIMNLLRKRMVDIYESNKYDYNALDLAIKGNHKEAVKYLLRAGNQWTEGESDSVNPYSVALIYKRNELTEILRENRIPVSDRPGIDQISISATVRHCVFDYMTGLSVMAKDPLLNIGFISGIDFKPFYTRVLMKENDNFYYQYRDKSAFFHAGVFKEISITDYPLRGNWSFIASLSAGYAFGNKLKGTTLNPGNKLKINPAAGFKWTKDSFGIMLNLEYLSTEFHNVGPLWLRIGFSHTSYFNQLRAPGKIIRWF